MRRKLVVAAAVALAVAGTVAVAGAQEGSPALSPGPRRAQVAARLGRAIRAEVVLPGRDGGPPTTIRLDRGVLRRVEGQTITLQEADGTTVTVRLDEGTRLRRDGRPAQPNELRPGDRVQVLRVARGGGPLVTRAVRALSPEGVAEAQARRDQRRKR